MNQTPSSPPNAAPPAPSRALILTLVGLAVVLVAGMIFVSGKRPNATITLERLDHLKASVTDYAREHGRLPDSLEVLNLPPETLNDHIGEPFQYFVKDGEVTILSHGLDKKPGGLMFHKDYKVEFRPLP